MSETYQWIVTLINLNDVSILVFPARCLSCFFLVARLRGFVHPAKAVKRSNIKCRFLFFIITTFPLFVALMINYISHPSLENNRITLYRYSLKELASILGACLVFSVFSIDYVLIAS